MERGPCFTPLTASTYLSVDEDDVALLCLGFPDCFGGGVSACIDCATGAADCLGSRYN